MFTPEQLQDVVEAKYKKTSAYQIEHELQHIKARTKEMQAVPQGARDAAWREEFMDLHQAQERLGVFDPEWRERQAIAGAAGMVAAATAVAPQVMVPMMGRMAIGGIAGESTRQVLLQEGFSEDAARFGSAVVGGAVSAHMPVGGLIARSAALTTGGAAAATAESGGLLSRLREAGRDLSQWRPDPRAMGSGGLPFTRKAPAPVASAARDAAAAPVVESGVSGAPVVISGTLPAPKMIRHHLFNKFRGQSLQSEKYREFFRKHKIDVDSYCIEIPESTHISKIHKAGENWTTRWKEWIDNHPKASTTEVYQFVGNLMDDYAVNHVKIIKYRD
jgi:hypothetical protein